MRKEEFFEKLEYLLQDIPDQDREDALDYYRDYLAEAGSGNEEAAIEDFGSPERVAAIIRADLAGNLNDGGSFTDRGYEDERFRDPGYQVAKRLDLPEERENAYGPGSGHAYEKDGWQSGPSREDCGYQDQPYEAARQAKKPWTSRGLKLVLWIVLIIAAFPVILGVGGVGLGAVTGVASLIFGAIAVVLCLTAAAFIAGVCLLVAGIIFLVTSPLDSGLMFGIAIAGIGVGLLGAVVLYAILAMLLPFLWNGMKRMGAWISRKWKEIRKV